MPTYPHVRQTTKPIAENAMLDEMPKAGTLMQMAAKPSPPESKEQAGLTACIKTLQKLSNLPITPQGDFP